LCAANKDLASRKIIIIFALRLFDLYGKLSLRDDRGQKCKEVLKNPENMHLKVDVREEKKPVQQPSLKIAGMKKNYKTNGEDCEAVLTTVA
jgi:hypothetical protein